MLDIMWPVSMSCCSQHNQQQLWHYPSKGCSSSCSHVPFLRADTTEVLGGGGVHFAPSRMRWELHFIDRKPFQVPRPLATARDLT